MFSSILYNLLSSFILNASFSLSNRLRKVVFSRHMSFTLARIAAPPLCKQTPGATTLMVNTMSCLVSQVPAIYSRATRHVQFVHGKLDLMSQFYDTFPADMSKFIYKATYKCRQLNIFLQSKNFVSIMQVFLAISCHS